MPFSHFQPSRISSGYINGSFPLTFRGVSKDRVTSWFWETLTMPNTTVQLWAMPKIVVDSSVCQYQPLVINPYPCKLCQTTTTIIISCADSWWMTTTQHSKFDRHMVHRFWRLGVYANCLSVAPLSNCETMWNDWAWYLQMMVSHLLDWEICFVYQLRCGFYLCVVAWFTHNRNPTVNCRSGCLWDVVPVSFLRRWKWRGSTSGN